MAPLAARLSSQPTLPIPASGRNVQAATTAAGVRGVLFPLSVKQTQASLSLTQMMGQARHMQEKVDPLTKPSMTAMMSRLRELQRASRATSPMWLVAAPAVQLPVFLTAVLSVRGMAVAHWPGFETGGLFWFTDLTAPALRLAELTAPLGSLGAALPAVVAAALFANIKRSFDTPPAGTAETQDRASALRQWALSHLRIALEWATVPLFVIALQLPQGAVLYWAASSSFALLQGWVMRQPAVARGLSLIPPPAVTQHAVMSRPNMLSEATAEGNLLPGEPMGVPLSPSAQAALPPQELVVSDEVQTLVAKAGDPHELLLKVSPASLRVNSFATPQAFLVVAWGDVTMQQADVQTQMAEAGNPHESQFRAAELRAAGQTAAALVCLQRLAQMDPNNGPAWYGRAKLHASLRQWPDAAAAYERAAKLQNEDLELQARCLYGADSLVGG
eukprot:jgi/Astpho2/4420/fgenesh1_pg.00067_%23_28_t